MGPWFFLLMINDFSVPSIFNMWKYVDDTAVSETIPKDQKKRAQDLVNLIDDWSKKNLFEVNCDKTRNLPTVSVVNVHCSQGHVLTETASNQFSAQIKSYFALWSILT